MTKCSVELSCNSKILLKVLTCLWNQYVLGHIQFTQVYQASPNADAYTFMEAELNALVSAMQANYSLTKLNVNAIQTESYVQLFVSDALGNIVYFNTSADSIIVGTNTYENAAQGTVISNGFLNAGTLKTVQKLNIDDSLENAYQIAPVYLDASDISGNPIYISATSASVVGRTGCAGCANTGFVSLSLIVDINAFQIPACISKTCLDH